MTLSGKQKPHVSFFFLFDTSLKLVGFALHLTKKSHMHIRVGLVLLTMTDAKEEVCRPTWAMNTKNTPPHRIEPCHSSVTYRLSESWR